MMIVPLLFFTHSLLSAYVSRSVAVHSWVLLFHLLNDRFLAVVSPLPASRLNEEKKRPPGAGCVSPTEFAATASILYCARRRMSRPLGIKKEKCRHTPFKRSTPRPSRRSFRGDKRPEKTGKIRTQARPERKGGVFFLSFVRARETWEYGISHSFNSTAAHFNKRYPISEGSFGQVCHHPSTGVITKFFL